MINAKVEGIEKYRRFHIPVAPPKKIQKQRIFEQDVRMFGLRIVHLFECFHMKLEKKSSNHNIEL